MAEDKNSFIINKKYDPLLFKTIIKRFWWWIPLLMVIMFAIAAIYLRYTKPVYQSQLILQIENEDNAKNVIDFENINTKKDVFYSEIELLRSELMFNRALKSLNMHVSIFHQGKILKEEKYKSGAFQILPYQLHDSTLVNFPINITSENNQVKLSYSYNGKNYALVAKPGERVSNEHFDIVIKTDDPKMMHEELKSNIVYFMFNSTQSLTDRFIGNLLVLPLDDKARTVQIGFKGDNPKLCQDITLALANNFIDYSVKLKKKSSESILSFIDVQLDSLSMELKRSKDSLMTFQRSVNLTNPEGNGEDIQSGVSRYEEDLFALQEEIAGLRNIQNKLRNNPNHLDVYRILPELMGKSYESAIDKHIEGLQLLLEEKEEILFRLTPESSEAKRIDKKVQEKIKLINRSIEAIDERLKDRTRVIYEKIGSLEAEYARLPEKRMEFNRLKNIQDLNEKYYQLLTEKKVQYSISDAGFASNNRILKLPSTDMTPVEPRSNMVYGGFVFFGLLLSLGILFFKYISFNEINLVEDLQNILPQNATILGGIPLAKYQLEYSQTVVSKAPKSMMAESLRKIRVNLNYIHPNYKTIAITSSISGEGKTFVALNLATIIAMSGKKTILLDLDLRKPKVHLAFGSKNDKGMSNLIIGRISLDEAIVKDVEANMDIITSGPIPPNPSELLLSDTFKTILADLKERYDVIIIDNPPIGLVSDGVQILTEADIPIYVFKSQYSKRNFAYRINELFDMKQIKSLNIILNGIESSKNSGYGYGYGYGYGNYGGYMEEDIGKDLKTIKRTRKIINTFKKKDAN